MYKAYIISEKLADELKDVDFAPDSKFNPFQCAKNDWYISIEEVRDNVLTQLPDLELVDFEPPLSAFNDMNFDPKEESPNNN